MYNKIVKFVKLEEVDSSQKFQYLMLKAIRKPKTRKIRTDDAILMVMSAIDHNKSIISRTHPQKDPCWPVDHDICQQDLRSRH